MTSSDLGQHGYTPVAPSRTRHRRERLDEQRAGARREATPNQLKRLLQGLDLLALTAGWGSAYLLVGPTWTAAPAREQTRLGLLLVAALVLSVSIMAVKRLWLSRICSVHSVELQRLGEMSVFTLLLVLSIAAVTDYDTAPDLFAFLGAGLSFLFLLAGRGAYRAWLSSQRRRGLLARRLLLVGANGEAQELTRMLQQNPSMGFSVVGVCADRDRVDGDEVDVPWMGGPDRVVEAVEAADASGALVVASAFQQSELSHVLRQLTKAGCHIHLSSGLSGIAHGRLRPLPFAREPLFYLEHVSLSRPQQGLKRALDLVIGTALLFVSVPMLVGAAVLIKLEDGGPVLFRQRRIGRDGRPFTLYKLRTMVVDAEARRAELQQANMRSGPLFKVASDPRITKVGAYLRALSIDELPQLLNVVRGDMSLIGPRPALPEEVEQFDEHLRERVRMMPGITGLWQIEARDDPSFDSYRRLDLFYIENWSVALDLSILLTTVGVILPRGLRTLRSSDTAA